MPTLLNAHQWYRSSYFEKCLKNKRTLQNYQIQIILAHIFIQHSLFLQ